MNKIINTLLIVILLCFSVGISYYYIKASKEHKITEDLYLRYKDSTRTYKLQVDSLEYTVTEAYAAVNTQKELLAKEVIDKELYKKLYLTSLSSITKLNGQIIILKDSLQVLPDSIFTTIVDTNRTYRAIKLPYEWSYKDKYLDFKTGIRENNHPYFSVNMSLDAKIIIGTRKQSIGILVTDNPYFITNKMEVTVVHPEIRWYNNKWLYLGTGFLSGILINRL